MAYRGDAEDTRNAPGLSLAHLLREQGFAVRLHDPHVRADDPNLVAQGLDGIFSRSLEQTLAGANAVVLAAPHRAYQDLIPALLREADLRPVFDGAQLLPRAARRAPGVDGIGRGLHPPPPQLIAQSAAAVRVVALAVAREVQWLADDLNRRFGLGGYGAADVLEVLRLVRTCPTGANLPHPDARVPIGEPAWAESRLVACATHWLGADFPTALPSSRG